MKHIYVDDEVHQELKIIAAQRGIKMGDVIAGMLPSVREAEEFLVKEAWAQLEQSVNKIKRGE